MPCPYNIIFGRDTAVPCPLYHSDATGFDMTVDYRGFEYGPTKVLLKKPGFCLLLKNFSLKKELLPIDFYRLLGYYLGNGSGNIKLNFATIPIIKLYFI